MKVLSGSLIVIAIISTLFLFLFCNSGLSNCKYDTDCKGDKVCRNGQCVGLYENLDISTIQDTDNAYDSGKDIIQIGDNNIQDMEDILDYDDLSDNEADDINAETDTELEETQDIFSDIVECPSPCEYEGKRYCETNGYVECKMLGGTCPEPVYKECGGLSVCRNGFCGTDECTPEDNTCLDSNNYSVCEIDEYGFYHLKQKKCEIGTTCYRKLCCPYDMVEADGFCIDRYEAIVSDVPSCSGNIYGQSGDNYPAAFPDDVDLEKNPPSVNLYTCSISSVLPSVFITFYQAKTVCKISGKRLCTETEYTIACTGGINTYKYPYGTSWINGRCNDSGFITEPSKTGSLSKCVSQYGAYDMSGNVEEWVEPEQSSDNPEAMGGMVGCRLGNASCSMCFATNKYPPKTTAINLGFRCCK